VGPSSSLIPIFEVFDDREYMAEVKEKLSLIAE
jgi:hypothetical protein